MINIVEDDTPEFLWGTFTWSVNGLCYNSDPNIDLLDLKQLKSKNPWLVLASILEHSKSGNHEYVPMLERFYNQVAPLSLNRISLLLTGDMATDDDIALLSNALESEDANVRMYASEAAALSGKLWLVPYMLAAWKKARFLDQRESIGNDISCLLEPRVGEIFDESSNYNLPPPMPSEHQTPRLKKIWENKKLEEKSPERFPGLVEEKYNKVVDSYGNEQVTVWGGKMFDVVKFTNTFLRSVQAGSLEQKFTYRHKFEANVGMDCRNFFKDKLPNKNEITKTLTNFLLSIDKETYKPGIRYFFGHKIT